MSLDVNILPPDYIDFTIGDFRSGVEPTIIEELTKKVQTDGNGYTPGLGLPLLREKIISHYRDTYGIKNISTENIQITVSCLHGAFLALKSIITSKDDEVIIIAPYFPSYINLIKGANGTPVVVKSIAPDFALPIKQIQDCVSEKTKAIIINYPNNPTGVGLSDQERNFLNELALEKNIFIIDDHVYSDYPSTHPYKPTSTDISHQVLVSSFSKNFAMPGIRLGYVIAPKKIIDQNAFYNEGITFSPPTISQYIGEIVLDNTSQYQQHLKDIEQKGKSVAQLFRSSNYFNSCTYNGGLYLFVKVTDEIKKPALFYTLLEEHFHVLVAPGDEFDYSNRYFRISLSATNDDLHKGVQKIIDCVDYTLNFKQ
ncbi:pyridoxal phosphate-dependent aminotransferase [Lactobacillus apis]|uniref:pyridoxal phosphate-dependent aminotransferase n=1 Tax=Lactobacillus apis TaxID=303541 RepID=UPI0013A54F64|nr:pyridoxal phosphate-dependent aminotransferase [Lactobacillus apis]